MPGELCITIALTTLLATALAAMGCAIGETPDVSATVAAELTRLAPTPTPTPDLPDTIVAATVAAELTRLAPTLTTTSTPKPTPTPTLRPTDTPIPTATLQPTSTLTSTATFTPTSTLTPTATFTPTSTLTPTATFTPRPTIDLCNGWYKPTARQCSTPPPIPTKTPTKLPYKISYRAYNYSAPSHGVTNIRICFEEHTHHDDGKTYAQDVQYRTKYKDRQGRTKSLTITFVLFDRGKRTEHIQAYESSSPGTFDDAPTTAIIEAFKGIKSGKWQPHHGGCN